MEIKRPRTFALQIFKTLNSQRFFISLIIIPTERMTYLYRVEKQQSMMIKVSGPWVYIYRTRCQEKFNLQPQQLFSKILSKFDLELNADVNCALSNPMYSWTKAILEEGRSRALSVVNNFLVIFVFLCWFTY